MQFILNHEDIGTHLPPATVLLDFIRYHHHLQGTKIGCREGDCGACSVLIGVVENDKIIYRTATSCLTALGTVAGKHVVTIEGTNETSTLNYIQQAFCEENATQCGFCTPGFIVSLAGFCLDSKAPTYARAIAAIDGNICRCTGYKSIERAAARVAARMQDRKEEEPLAFATSNHILPEYLLGIPQRLQKIERDQAPAPLKPGRFLGGGTDLYVQQPERMHMENIHFLSNINKSNPFIRAGDICTFDGQATVTDMLESPLIRQYFPSITAYAKLISSTPIRNIATIAGNFINASPIGDLTIFFLALDARLTITNGTHKRELPLRELYKGYKLLNKSPEEYIEKISFALPGKNTYFHFEKVSKRTHLDIASVNTALCLEVENDQVVLAGLSAGGVGPVPAFLSLTSAFLQGKKATWAVLSEALEIAQTEISPISDARGTAAYKRLLLRQLIIAHFMHLFPAIADTINMRDLVPYKNS